MTLNKLAVGTLGAVVFALALVFTVAPAAHADFGDDGYAEDGGGYGYTGGNWGVDGFGDSGYCDYGCGGSDLGDDSGYCDFGCDGDNGSDCDDFGCGGGYGDSTGSGCSSCGGGSFGGGSFGGGVYIPPSHTTVVQPPVTNVNNNYNNNQNQNVNNVNVNVGSTDNNDHNDHNYSNRNRDRKIAYHSPVVYNPPVYTPYVTLSQVPYTGLELGFWGTIAYWGFLVLWCLLAAYLIAVKKVHTRWANRIKVFLFGDESEVSHPAYMQVETPVFAAASAAVAPQIATLGEVPMHRAETAVANDEDTTDPFILSQINRYN